MMRRTALGSAVSLVLALAALPATTRAAEQAPAADDTTDFGEIVITANKRQQNLSEVGISVSAYSGEQLKELGVTDTTAITQQIPGLHYNAFSPGLTFFGLRGVSQNNFTDNLEAPVAVYMDNAYMGSMNGVSGQLFDTKRVEVLRGPQGTLFGRNATGGLIHYLSVDASETETNGYLEAGYGNYNDYALEGAVGGSISERVRYRVAGRLTQADGYIKSVDFSPGLPGSGQDLGGKDGIAGRATLQIDVTDDLLLNLWVKYSEDKDVATGGYVFENCNFEANGYCSVNGAGLSNGTGGVINGITAEPASPWEHFGERPGHLNRKATIVQADAVWNINDNLEFTTITNAVDLTKDYAEDGDALPVLVINFDTDVKYKQFSQEFRLAGKADRLNWQTGLYYLDMNVDGSIVTRGAPVFGAAVALNEGFDDPSVPQTYQIDSKNWSVFGQVDFALTDTVKLIGGLRYSKDTKSMDYLAILSDPTFAPDQVLASSALFEAIVPGVNDISYGDWATRAAIEWKSSEDTLLFASWNRGIKGGNWSLASDIQATSFKHKPETLDSFEVGVKTAVLDRSLRINGTVFHYDYKDYQAFALTGGTPQVTNSDATSTGAELEAFWSPNDRFNAIFGATWQTSKVDQVDGAKEQIGPEFFPDAPSVGPCTNEGGFFFCDYPEDVIRDAKFPNAPKFSVNYLLRYNVDIGPGNTAFQVDGAWYDDQYMEVTNGPSSLQKAYNVTNASIMWTHATSGISVQGWVKNVFEEEYRLYTLNLGILGTTSVYAPPRTYGITVRVPFGN